MTIVADTAYDVDAASVLVKSVGDGTVSGPWVQDDFFVCGPDSLTLLARATHEEVT